jgi:hypothetical protein
MELYIIEKAENYLYARNGTPAKAVAPNGRLLRHATERPERSKERSILQKPSVVAWQKGCARLNGKTPALGSFP